MAKFSWRYDPKDQEFKKAFLLAGNLVQEAANAAVYDSALEGVRKGRANIAAAGLPKIWQSSLRFKMITPKDSPKPVAYVNTKINYGDVFEKDHDIQGQPLIWLPLPSVPRNPGSGLRFGGVVGRNHMTPQQYARKVGKLVTLKRPGKAPLLGAAIKQGNKAQPFGAFATKRQLKRGAKEGEKVQFIPLFVGVPAAHVGKRTDIQAALKAGADKMAEFYEEEIKKLDAKKLLQG